MGKHRLPDPGEPKDQPSDDYPADSLGPADGSPRSRNEVGAPGDHGRRRRLDPPTAAEQTDYLPRIEAERYPPGGSSTGEPLSGDYAEDDHAEDDYESESAYEDYEDDYDDSAYPPGPHEYADEDDAYAADGDPANPYPVGAPATAEAGDEYPQFPARTPSSDAPPTGPRRALGGHRGLSEWRGGHRNDTQRRGVSIGVIVMLVVVVVVVGFVIVWKFFGDVLSNRGHTAAGRCISGKESVAVIVDPSIADSVQEFAQSYNATGPRVGDHCMVVSVKQASSDAVLNGFVGKWPADLGGQPALWIPGSSISAARLTAASGQKAISESRSLVTSPVLLAIRPELQQALGNQTWANLPGLQTNPTALASLNLPTWGSLRVALPMNGNGDAAFLAGEAVAAASVPAGAPVTQGTTAVRALQTGQPKLGDNSLAEAMNTLLKPGDAGSAPVHAVITTEQQLFQRGQSLADAKKALASWLPPGPVPVADYPTVLLSGSWLTQEQTAAASEFDRFMRKPEQLTKLARAGFRVSVNGVKPPSSPVTSFAALAPTLTVGDGAVQATLAEAMAAPANGVAATIMLDQSLPSEDAGKSRLANVVTALNDKIKGLPANSVMGLWTFDGHEGRSEVATGPLGDPVNGQPRSAALVTALDKQYSSNGGAVSFTTLRMIYQELQAHYVAGQTNSILVITAGPHTDQSMDGAALQDFIRQSADPAKPIAVNVIDFGNDPDRAAWEGVARLSGGGYQNLSTSASPELATAINTFLG